MKSFVTIFIVVLSLSSLANGLECYVCTSSDVSWDEVCETGNSTLLPSIECPTGMKYCTYTKTKWNTISGANSVLRGCTDEPLYRNGQQDLEGGNVTVWYESCYMDLCNEAQVISKDLTLTTLSVVFSLLLATRLK